MLSVVLCIVCFTDTATPEIYTYLHTLSLHDAHPNLCSVGNDIDPYQDASLITQTSRKGRIGRRRIVQISGVEAGFGHFYGRRRRGRSEEHTSELQSLMRI